MNRSESDEDEIAADPDEARAHEIDHDYVYQTTTAEHDKQDNRPTHVTLKKKKRC